MNFIKSLGKYISDFIHMSVTICVTDRVPAYLCGRQSSCLFLKIRVPSTCLVARATGGGNVWGFSLARSLSLSLARALSLSLSGSFSPASSSGAQYVLKFWRTLQKCLSCTGGFGCAKTCSISKAKKKWVRAPVVVAYYCRTYDTAGR